MQTEKFSHPERIVREPERRRLTGIPTSTWYALQARGLAPKPIRLGVRSVGWRLSSLMSFVDDCEARGNWQQLGDVAKRVIEKAR